MRTIFLPLLLAGAASPAVAQIEDSRAERQAERAERAAARADRLEARREAAQEERSERQEERSERQEMRAPRAERAREAAPEVFAAPEPRRERPVRERVEEAVEGADSLRDWRRPERQRADSPSVIEDRNLRRGRTGDFVEQTRPLPPVFERNRRRVISTTPQVGTEPPPPPTASTSVAQPTRHWTTDWRRHGRYNWYDHRRRNRSLFRLGFYFDPFGWSYYRYGIGWRLWPSYYSSRYWMHDPWMYRLPPAYGPYRWVRYWDDALLVNVYTGEVVDVIYNFFW